MKKRIIAALLASMLIISAAACGSNEKKSDKDAGSTTKSASDTAKPASDTAKQEPAANNFKSADEIAKAVLAEVTINSAKDKSKDKLPDYFDSLDIGTIEDSAMYVCASGAYPDEFAVIRFNSEESAKNAVPVIMARLIEQKETYQDYTPDEMYKFDDAAVSQSGVWVYYIVTSDNKKAEEIVKGYIG